MLGVCAFEIHRLLGRGASFNAIPPKRHTALLLATRIHAPRFVVTWLNRLIRLGLKRVKHHPIN